MIVGLDHADDAGVYRVTDDIALIQTVDFFTPIVDDPYSFGQIAAANALSDVYAMGGVPKTAMNLVGFPIKEMDISILRRIIRGGLDKLSEAGVILVGGHSVEDKELKYGLSVTGFVHPEKVLTKKHLRQGDRLILTKPLGTGIINTAIKGGLAPEDLVRDVTRLMATLNRGPAEIMGRYPVHACTDITGFGLLGHLAEMVLDSPLGLAVHAERVPVMSAALEYAGMGLMPAGLHKNREFHGPSVICEETVSPVKRDILFDPQTSGGLLIALPGDHADELIRELRDSGIPDAAVIGEVVPAEEKKRIRVL